MHRLLACLVLLLPPAALAQTFTVEVVSKTEAHPYFGQGHPDGYSIDGVQGAELTLLRGQTYTFQMDGVPSLHPFYLSTSATGGGADPWTEGVTGAPATGNATITFAVPLDAPAELWYQCNFHPFMGYRLVIEDATNTPPPPDARALRLEVIHNPAAAPALAVTTDDADPVRVRVYDVRGRVVARLYDGPLAPGVEYRFRVPGLAPGAYFVRVTAAAREVVRGVTVVQ